MSEIDIHKEILDMLKAEEFSRMSNNSGDLSNDRFILSQIRYQKLANEIMRHVDIYTRDELAINAKIKFKFTNSWLVRHHKGDHSHKHSHSNSVLSGIVYLDVSPETGNIHFEKSQTYVNLFPLCLDLDFDEYNNMNAREIVLVPKNNQILIFPSHLEHTVMRSKSDRLRYCLAFNLYPQGSIGMDKKLSNLEIR